MKTAKILVYGNIVVYGDIAQSVHIFNIKTPWVLNLEDTDKCTLLFVMQMLKKYFKCNKWYL